MGAHAAYPPLRSPALFLALWLCALNIYVSSGAPDADTGAASLLDFKSFLIVPAGAPLPLESWNASARPCNGSRANWAGVLCKRSLVRGLRLDNIGLSGQIHAAALASLPYLRTLSLVNNTFRGPFPANINSLAALNSLYLSNNAFSGDIPDGAFAGLPFLQKLFLQDNQFTGQIPSSLAALPRLRQLHLDRNLFQGPIPNFQQKRFAVVTLSDNNLEGPVPEALSEMPPTSFSGNEDLCGQPLHPCSVPLSPAPLPPVITGPPAPKNSSAGSKIAIIVLSIALALAALALIWVLGCYRSGRRDSDLDSISSLDSQSDMASSPGGPVGLPENPKRTGNRTQLLTFIREERETFDMHDLMRASAEVLGSGSFGASYKAAVFGGRSVVVKRYKAMNNVGREEFKEHMTKLGRLGHPNLLPLLAYYYQKEEKLLVSDFVDKGSLASHLHGKRSEERPGLDWGTRLKIIKGVVKGMAYLHAELRGQMLPHGHLKSSNVLLSESLEPLLVDYALVPLITPQAAQKLMVAYKSPEYAQLGRIHKKTDVFSLGILILEVLTGKFPASYLSDQAARGSVADSVMAWVDSIARDFQHSAAEVFDKDMGPVAAGEIAEEGKKCSVLRIGLACCHQDVEKRCDLREVVEKLQQIKQREPDFTSLRSFELINAQHVDDGETHHGR